VRSVLFTNTLGTPDLIGCWHPIGSFAHVFDTQSGRAELGATAFISMVDRVSSTASNQPVDLWSRVHTQQKRSILELFDLLLDAAAKHEVFARSRAQAHTLRAVDNVALERFATKRRVEMLAALSSQYLANEQGADVLLEPCWRSAAASATNLQQRLQQRLATLC
jgi:hypothetical protein